MAPSRVKPRLCAVSLCNQKTCKDSQGKKVSYHTIPTQNVELRKVWLKNILRTEETLTKSSCVCSLHFLQSDFKANVHDVIRFLKPGSVPTVFPWEPNLFAREKSQHLKSIQSSTPGNTNSTSRISTTAATVDKPDIYIAVFSEPNKPMNTSDRQMNICESSFPDGCICVCAMHKHLTNDKENLREKITALEEKLTAQEDKMKEEMGILEEKLRDKIRTLEEKLSSECVTTSELKEIVSKQKSEIETLQTLNIKVSVTNRELLQTVQKQVITIESIKQTTFCKILSGAMDSEKYVPFDL